jgi:hypothetical protein
MDPALTSPTCPAQIADPLCSDVFCAGAAARNRARRRLIHRATCIHLRIVLVPSHFAWGPLPLPDGRLLFCRRLWRSPRGRPPRWLRHDVCNPSTSDTLDLGFVQTIRQKHLTCRHAISLLEFASFASVVQEWNRHEVQLSCLGVGAMRRGLSRPSAGSTLAARRQGI